MHKTNIEWTEFASNPWKQRCKRKCRYCFAWRLYPRVGYTDNPTLSLKELASYKKRKKPTKIFMGDMTDLLGEWVPSYVIEACIHAAGECPQHTFQFLTKNPRRYLEFEWPKNCWLGATATDQKSYAKAAFAFEDFKDGPPDVNDNLTFVSCEPLLGRIDVTKYNWIPHWLIVGALTGPKAKEFKPDPEYVNLIRCWHRECWNKPLFLKDNLNWPEKIQEWPE